MQTGPYITERLMPKIVATYCAQHAIDFQAFSDEWVLRLARGDATKWIVGYKFDLNGSAAAEVAQDKVATYEALDAAGIDAVPHYLVRSFPREVIHEDLLHHALGGVPLVAKPLNGTSGRGVARYGGVNEVLAMVRGSGEPAWAVAPYYDLQAEYRLVMLDGEVILAYAKTQPTDRGGLRLFNLSLGAVPAMIDNDELLGQLTSTARDVMRVMALRLAAVDIVRMSDGGTLKVLEVNDGIIMEHYARHSAENYGRAAEAYHKIMATLFSA